MKTLIQLSSISLLLLSTQLHAATQDPNPLARFGTKHKTNWFVSGAAVWYKPLADNFPSVTTIVTNTTDKQSYTVENYNFQPAFRVALGYNSNFDGWDLSLNYTNFNYSHKVPYTLYTDERGTILRNINGHTNYTIHMNLGDLDLGRMFKTSQHLYLRPHAGVRGLWLNRQNSSIYFNQTSNRDGYIKNRFKDTLVGLEGGLDTLFRFSKMVSVFANLTFSGLVDSQKINNSTKRTIASSALNTYNPDSSSRIVTGVDMAIGLQFDTNFKDDSYHLGIKVAYEQMSYINMQSPANALVMHMSLKDTNMRDSNFALQGISVGARFDF